MVKTRLLERSQTSSRTSFRLFAKATSVFISTSCTSTSPSNSLKQAKWMPARYSYLRCGYVLPYIVLVPSIAKGTMPLGDLQRLVFAFICVEGAFQFIVRNWTQPPGPRCVDDMLIIDARSHSVIECRSIFAPTALLKSRAEDCRAALSAASKESCVTRIRSYEM